MKKNLLKCRHTIYDVGYIMILDVLYVNLSVYLWCID
jgi:hypothetical protein